MGRGAHLKKKTKSRCQNDFLRVYEACGSVKQACGITGIGRRTVYKWKDTDQDFRARFYESREILADKCEMEAVRRAVIGVQKPIFHKGIQVGTVREYSDLLLIFLLKGVRPEKFRNISIPASKTKEPPQLTVTIGGPRQSK